MTEYPHVERPFLDHLARLGWTVIDQRAVVPTDQAASLRDHIRAWLLPTMFRDAVRASPIRLNTRIMAGSSRLPLT